MMTILGFLFLVVMGGLFILAMNIAEIGIRK